MRTVTTSVLAAAVALLFALTWGGPPVDAAAPREAPEIEAGAWLNSPPLRRSDLEGKVVLVEFWTFGCHNCKNVEPYLKAWHARYADQGLVVIAVHTPEFRFERDLENVRSYVDENEIESRSPSTTASAPGDASETGPGPRSTSSTPRASSDTHRWERAAIARPRPSSSSCSPSEAARRLRPRPGISAQKS